MKIDSLNYQNESRTDVVWMNDLFSSSLLINLLSSNLSRQIVFFYHRPLPYYCILNVFFQLKAQLIEPFERYKFIEHGHNAA